MTNLRLLAFTVSLCLASAAALAAPPACAQLFAGGQPPALVNPKLARRTTMLCNDAYASLASGVTHGALWSAEHPTADSLADARSTPRQGEFHTDDRLPRDDAAQLDDYRRSGYERGHMTPSGDMPDDVAQEQSFSLANMVPQTAQLNRGIWEGVENAVRQLAEQRGELYLVTGPAFYGSEIKSVGADGVLVPTSTWKAVYDPAAGGTGVYVCKNAARPTCATVSVAILIQAVGIDPFPGLPPALKQVAMQLPPPEDSPYAAKGHHRRRRDRSLSAPSLDP